MGKSKPAVVHGNNNSAIKLADTGLKSNYTISAHIVEEKEGWYKNGLIIMTCGMITPIQLQKRMNRRALTHSRVTIAFLNSPKPNTTEDQKQEL